MQLGGFSLCSLDVVIAHPLGGFVDMLPLENISSFRITEIKCVQSLVAWPFPCTMHRVTRSRSQQCMARTGE